MVKTKSEMGDVYIASTGTVYASDDITPDTIENTRQNIYGRGVSRRLQSLIFPEEYTITVEDPEGNVDDEQSNIIDKMCSEIMMWANMQKAYDDILWHGISIFNPVWGTDDESRANVIIKLRHLPANSFTNAPPGVITTYARRLLGIVLNTKGEIEFWQTNKDGQTILINNAASVINPTARFIDGDPEMLPLVPIIDMLKYTWNAAMQQVNRVGSKILFIKVTDPQPASERNGNVGDVEYANIILKNWGKDTAFQLRENMELVDLQIKDDSNNLEVIDSLYNMIVDYISPAGFIARQGENGLAGGEKEREKLLSQVISSIHSWVEEQFEQVLNKYFEYNGFPPGWKIKINIPSPRVDQTEANLKKAELCVNAKLLPPSRLLELLDMEPLTPEEEAELAAYNETRGGLAFTDPEEYTQQNRAVEDKIVSELTKGLTRNINILERNVIKSLNKITAEK